MDYPGEKLLLKLWETLAEKGIGSLLAPWQEKRLAQARGEIRCNEMLLIAQTEKEIESIKAGTSVYQFKPEINLLQAPSESIVEQARIEPILNLSDFAIAVSKSNFSDSI